MLNKHTDIKSAYKRAEAYLTDAIKNGRMPHALIIAGPQGSGRRDLARFVCEKLLGLASGEKLDVNPDYTEIDCDPKKTDIDTIRNLQEELRKRPFADGYRTVLFTDSHLLKEQYQNTLLKTIEEPPNNTLFILAGNEAGLLPTIRSRCAIIRLGIRDEKDIEEMLLTMGASFDDARLYTSVSGGVPGRAEGLYTDDEKKKIRNIALSSMEAVLSKRLEFVLGQTIETKAQETDDKGRGLAQFALDCLLSFMRDLLLLKTGFEVMENVDRAEKLRAIAERFTSGRINCIIDLLLEAKVRIGHYANPERTLDRLMIDITEVL